MHSCNGNAILQAHQFSQHLRPLDHRNMLGVRGGDFRVIAGDGGAGYNHLRAGDIFRPVPFKDDCAQVGQPLSNCGAFQVRSGNFVAKRQQDFSNAAHADSANTHKMYALNFREHDLFFSLRRQFHGHLGYLPGCVLMAQRFRFF